jgi:hypothetical protein
MFPNVSELAPDAGVFRRMFFPNKREWRHKVIGFQWLRRRPLSADVFPNISELAPDAGSFGGCFFRIRQKISEK